MTTLFNILHLTARALRGLRSGTATGGSTSTLVDTALTEPNDYLNGGTLLILSGLNAGKALVITDWNSATFTFTFATQGAACAAGDRYAAMEAGYYTREAMVQAVNDALASLGPFDGLDESLTTTADTESYALPAGVADLRQVWIATETAAPYYWSECHHWCEMGGKLYLDLAHLPHAARLIRLVYGKAHASVSLDADTVTDDVHPERLAAEAARAAASNRAGYAESSEPNTQTLLALLTQKCLEMHKYPVRRTSVSPRWNNLF